jgi:RND superfamily putative drug exporter
VIARLAKLATKRPKRVLIAVGVLVVLAAVLGTPVTGMLTSGVEEFQDPSSQYERANKMVSAATGQYAFYNAVVLLRGPDDIRTDAGAQRAVATVSKLVAHQHGFQRLAAYSPSQSHSPSQSQHPPSRSQSPSPSQSSAALVSRNGHETIVLAAFATMDDATDAISHLRLDLKQPPIATQLNRMHVRFGGVALVNEELDERTITDLERAELFALPIVLLLSFLIFRGLIAALLPPLIGGISILLTFLLLRIVDQFTPLSVFALNLVSGMGLGLGIDYSLFILYRYREELARGISRSEAVSRTLQTAGRTVLFSCLTVAAALTCLLVFPLRFLYSMGAGGAFVALCDGAVALLLLPSLLIVLGPRIDALSPQWLRRRSARTSRIDEDGRWWKLARGVMRRPGIVAITSAVVLLAAALPTMHLSLTSPGANLLPPSAESRQVETALADNFPSNAAESIEIVMQGSQSSAKRLAAESGRTAGPLASVTAPRYLGNRTWEIVLLPHGSPFSSAQQQLLGRLRQIGEPYRALVGGATAFFADQKSSIAAHLLPALLILFALTACFLFLMTGSLVIPIKAMLMNMLSISVGAGLLVLIFQDGHLSSLLGFKPIGGLEESTLVLMFVVAFALSTDYEVFVLARVKEARDSGLSNRDAIAVGLERTGRIITAAALLFCVAIGALAVSNLFFTKQLGLGTALAVAIDASIVRALLVPSLMALLGDWNWWAPGPLRRLYERFGLHEGPASGQPSPSPSYLPADEPPSAEAQSPAGLRS